MAVPRVSRIRRSVPALVLALALLFPSVLVAPWASGCTRVVFLGANGGVITARSMDWKVDIGTNLWIFPRGMQRTGAAGPNSVKWTSRYGSLIASGYDVSTTDGMNEKGLVANLLWLAESEYPTPQASKPSLALSLWAQYVLDNFATVEEAVDALKPEPFTVVTANVPGEDRLATVHLSISDASGDSAIIEYIGGKQIIHHDRKYQVMTNSPAFEKQLAMEEYWREIGGTVFLPGTNRAADRFARASFLYQYNPERSESRPGGSQCVQRDSQRLRSLWHYHSGPAEHFLHALANGCRSETADLFLRIGAHSECVLGGYEGPRFQRA